MTQPQIEVTLVLVATAVACALPGVFLVLRRLAMLSDAIGHVLLFGIVVAFFLTHDLKSPWLLLGASLTGVATVALVEVLQRSRLVKEDAAIGLVFPALFAAGVLLVSLYVRNIHLDVDRVLLGSPEYAPIRRFVVGGYDFGPYSLVVMAAVLLLNAGLIALFFKELKLATFDAALAASLGFAPAAVHYGLMALVSLTAVTAFDAVGPVLVVAFMVVPAATAYLLTDRLSRMLMLSGIIGAAGGVIGTFLAFELNTTIAGTAATVLGLQFALALILAPERGLVARAARRLRQRREFFETVLAIHLLHHEGTPEEAEESRVEGLHRHLRWKPGEVERVVRRSERAGLLAERDGQLTLTEAGRERAREALGIAD